MPCSSYMLVMMTVDRFQAICYPLTNQGWLHEHSLKVSYLGIWLGKVGVSNASLSRGLVRSRSWNSFRLGLNLIHILFANASIIRSCKLPNGFCSSFLQIDIYPMVIIHVTSDSFWVSACCFPGGICGEEISRDGVGRLDLLAAPLYSPGTHLSLEGRERGTRVQSNQPV